MTPEFQISHLHAALQKQSWFGFTLTLEQEPSACRLAAAEQRQFASISRTGSHWHHRPCDSSISVPLLRLQACSARRRAWGVWWAGRQVRACVDGGWTWVAGTESDGHETDHGGGLRKESLEEEWS